MYRVEMYARVRRACRVEGMSTREASRVFGLDRKTVRKMLSFSVPPGYRRGKPPRRPKLGPFTGIIDRILEDDRTSHHKQRHTAKRIFDRLRDEYGFTGGYTIVKDYVREQGLRSREVFVPLSHSSGPCSSGLWRGGWRSSPASSYRKIAFPCVMTLPHSDACFVAAYPAAATEAWLRRAQREPLFFSAAFPNRFFTTTTKLSGCRASWADGTRQRTRVVQRSCSPITSSRTATAVRARVTTKAMWRGLVGFMPGGTSWSPLPACSRASRTPSMMLTLEEQCRNRARQRRLRGHKREHRRTVSCVTVEALKRPLPPAPNRRVRQAGHWTGQLRCPWCATGANDYSVPVAYGHQ